ncbi:hypothetical protein Pmani_014215 [Petrolisthes manimaculis]|uniref:Uncharacterized protein n=1 Tax=Petrolisthes manimaculis TaxID=1843537 RepID=A0AAE1UCV1_9EUCA|nr:hypothetical protein Pmani_014215 [Petrolisthes manimaculis]
MKRSMAEDHSHAQDRFDENDEAVQALLDEKRKAFIDWQNHSNCSSRHDRYKDCKARTQRELCNMQNQWCERKPDEVQLYADFNNSKMLFSALRSLSVRNSPSALC